MDETNSNSNEIQNLKQRITELEAIESDYIELKILVEYLQLRKQATDDFQNKLKILNEIIIDLDRTDSFDELCRLGIEFGITRLGFDRLSLWFLDEKREWMCGTFGVDEYGNIRDERNEAFEFAGETLLGFYDRKKQVVVNSDVDLLDANSNVIGSGWHISVPLLDGHEFVGFMAADNWTSQKSLQPYQPELLQIYGTTVGYLAKSKLDQAKVHKLLQAIEHSSSSIILLNAEGIIEYANSVFERLSGYSQDIIIDQSLEFLVTQVECKINFETIWEMLQENGIWRGEWQTNYQSNSVLNLLVSISAVKNNKNITTHYVMVQEDITAHKRIEEQRLNILLERERVQLLETFITNVAHEFKTPLSVIYMKTYILDRIFDNEKALPHLNQIDEQSNYLNHMIDDMLTMVQLQSNQKYEYDDIDMTHLMESCVRQIRDLWLKKKIVVKLHPLPDASIQGDFGRLQQSFIELLENAIKFTNIGGNISIKIISMNHKLRIEIEDNGIGIVPDELIHIFKSLYRIDKARTKRGTGLGLSITKKIIEDHGGEIIIESQIDIGTKAIVYLPSE